MSRVDELIKEKCPNGVEYVSLKDVTVALPKGTLKTSELIEDGEYPVINSGRSYYGRYNDYNNEDAITIAARGEYAGFINYNGGKFWAGGLCYPYKSKDESRYSTKFIFYALKNKQEYIRETLVAKGSIPALNKQDIDKFKIPMPPIEVQQEVAGMLNSFTELEAELEAELVKRKQQYEHYRDHLLSFENIASDGGQVEWLTLGDVCEKISNVKWTPEQTYQYIDLTSVDRETNSIANDLTIVDESNAPSRARQIVKTGDILFGTTRPTLMRFCLVPKKLDNQLCSTGYCVLRTTDKVINKYIYYHISSNSFKAYCENTQKGASYPAITDSEVKMYKVPIPSKEIQERIVYVLDNFDTVCNDLSIGLPAEIEARHKQYEYYRDKLLTFRER